MAGQGAPSAGPAQSLAGFLDEGINHHGQQRPSHQQRQRVGHVKPLDVDTPALALRAWSEVSRPQPKAATGLAVKEFHSAPARKKKK